MSPLKTSDHFKKNQPEVILVLVAMQEEAKKILKKLNLNYFGLLSDYFKHEVYSGMVNNKQIYLITNGSFNNISFVGAEPATLAAVMGIQRFKPDLLLNVGTSGALLSQNNKIADVFMASEVNFIGRHIPISGFEKYNKGNFKPTFKSHKIKQTIVYSSVSFVTHDYIKNHFTSHEEHQLFDMEAASIAFVAEQVNISYGILKGITDFIDTPENYDQFVYNFSKTMDHLADTLKDVLYEI